MLEALQAKAHEETSDPPAAPDPAPPEPATAEPAGAAGPPEPVAAAPEPTPSPAAPALPSRDLKGTGLPLKLEVRTTQEADRILDQIELALVAGGFEEELVSGTTSGLKATLHEEFTFGQVITLAPRGTYQYIAREVQAGTRKSAVRAGLTRAWQQGRL